MRPSSTPLRFVCSRDAAKLVLYTNQLPYMVEKVNICYSDKDKKHYFWFILPEELEMQHEQRWGDLDK